MRDNWFREEEGFTLLEVLISFVILAGAMSIIFQLIFSGSGQSTRSHTEAQALLIAKSILDTPLVDRGVSNGMEKGYEWRRVVIPSTPLSDRDYPVKLVDVEVSIHWMNGSGPQQLILNTQKLLEVASDV